MHGLGFLVRGMELEFEGYNHFWNYGTKNIHLPQESLEYNTESLEHHTPKSS